jgi:polysaccharide deacetylase family protein (PEP-CTERM system associated)
MTQKYFLFSVDLEDVRNWMPDGKQYRERVPAMTERYLRWLGDHKMKATFFVVGDVAQNYPGLIKTIAEEGHEVACHSNRHILLHQQTPESLKADLEENMLHLANAGVKNIHGFRAPVFSLTKKTQWAYDVLMELGFVYSSSVLPSKNPLNGWPEFGRDFKRIENKIWELPITLFPLKFFSIPCAGGMYFRGLPIWVTRLAFNYYRKKNQPVLSYFHPYDIDTEQERFMHPGIRENRFYNYLMYWNRKTVLAKLETIIQDGWQIMPYHDYVKQFL